MKSFLGEIDEILKGERFQFRSATLDSVIQRQSVATAMQTINRKMAALSKLLRKASRWEISLIYRNSSGRRSGNGPDLRI